MAALDYTELEREHVCLLTRFQCVLLYREDTVKRDKNSKRIRGGTERVSYVCKDGSFQATFLVAMARRRQLRQKASGQTYLAGGVEQISFD